MRTVLYYLHILHCLRTYRAVVLKPKPTLNRVMRQTSYYNYTDGLAGELEVGVTGQKVRGIRRVKT